MLRRAAPVSESPAVFANRDYPGTHSERRRTMVIHAAKELLTQLRPKARHLPRFIVLVATRCIRTVSIAQLEAEVASIHRC
jgi:hypothetical protein